MKTYEVKIGKETFTVKLQKSNYSNNNRLAVKMDTVSDGELFAVITVNIDDELSGDVSNHAFVDTNNCGFWGVEKFLQENEVAKPTGFFGLSGYCVYPEYCFDLSKLGCE